VLSDGLQEHLGSIVSRIISRAEAVPQVRSIVTRRRHRSWTSGEFADLIQTDRAGVQVGVERRLVGAFERRRELEIAVGRRSDVPRCTAAAALRLEDPVERFERRIPRLALWRITSGRSVVQNGALGHEGLLIVVSRQCLERFGFTGRRVVDEQQRHRYRAAGIVNLDLEADVAALRGRGARPENKARKPRLLVFRQGDRAIGVLTGKVVGSTDAIFITPVIGGPIVWVDEIGRSARQNVNDLWGKAATEVGLTKRRKILLRMADAQE